MIHLGIDHHKKFSHVVALNDAGAVLWDGQIGSDREAFEELKNALPAAEPVQSVLEAGRNWGPLYDALVELGLNPKLANPLRMRLIAETFTKTDRIDATTHALILKAGLTPLVHVPPKEIRDQKNLLRQRIWLVKVQTMLKNRIHILLDRNHAIPPKVSDLFGKRGTTWLEELRLSEPDGKLLRGDLELLDAVQLQIRHTERWIKQALKDDPQVPILESLPGVGPLLAAIISLEINDISRFASPAKLCSYSGLVNSTYSSGGRTFHGGLVPACNHYLRYAFIEAAWGAIRTSSYFEAFYRRIRSRKGSQDAAGAVGRKLCEIAYHCLKQRRNYKEKPYRFWSGRLASRLAGS